ncbi:MAG: urea carboxylase-associated family protein [Gammaproteobacteria bacterium]|nr:urea carboxylase-associated family protein [Gammaproteobacteria bacterium]
MPVFHAATSRTIIPPGCAVGVGVTSGQHVRIINTEGGQVVDTWAFNPLQTDESLSMAHSRTATYHLFFRPRDQLVSNRFNPMLTILEDSSPGTHDTLHAACSAGSNAFFGNPGPQPNCHDNLIRVMADHGHELKTVPCPWNLFEHTEVDGQMNLVDRPAAAAKGDYIELKAEQDILLVCSACPSMIGMISGDSPKGAAIEIQG